MKNMTKKSLMIVLLLFCSTLVFSQKSALVGLKFEEAEIAFSKNDYYTTIEKLDEYDKLLGAVDAKSLYLRIVAKNALFERFNDWDGSVFFTVADSIEGKVVVNGGRNIRYHNLEVGDEILKVNNEIVTDTSECMDLIRRNGMAPLYLKIKRGDKEIEVKTSTAGANFHAVSAEEYIYRNEGTYQKMEDLRKLANAYLKSMEREGLDDKYREIYNINEKLKTYPKDKATWLKEKEQRELEKQRKAAKKKADLEKIKKWDEKKDQYYREIAPKIDAWQYKDGIQIGMDFKELKATKKDWFKGHKYYKYINLSTCYSFSNIFKEALMDDNNKLEGYRFELPSTSENLQKITNDLEAYFGQGFIPEMGTSIVMRECYIVVHSPYAKTKIVITFPMDGRGRISISKVSQNIKMDLLTSKMIEDIRLKYVDVCDPAYLDRFMGTYESETGFLNVSRSDMEEDFDKLPIFKLEGGVYNFYYYSKNAKEGIFFCVYKIERENGKEVGEKDYYKDPNKVPEIIFNIEQGTMLRTYSDGTKEIFNKRW